MMMPYLVGMARAKSIMMQGGWISAEAAQEMGLVNEIVSPDELMPKAIAVAKELGSRNPATLRLIKHVMNAPLRSKLDEVLEREDEVIKASIKSLRGQNPLAAM